jgi:hypothetical protein
MCVWKTQASRGLSRCIGAWMQKAERSISPLPAISAPS